MQLFWKCINMTTKSTRFDAEVLELSTATDQIQRKKKLNRTLLV